MKKLIYSTQFKKDFKRYKKRSVQDASLIVCLANFGQR